MNTLGIYIYNSTRDQWLQENRRSWGPFSSAFEWSEAGDEAAEAVRLRVTKNGDTTFTMAALH